jgi:hypothetical protein
LVLAVARSSTTVAEIADRLFLSEGTVHDYLSSATTKAGAQPHRGSPNCREQRLAVMAHRLRQTQFVFHHAPLCSGMPRTRGTMMTAMTAAMTHMRWD